MGGVLVKVWNLITGQSQAVTGTPLPDHEFAMDVWLKGGQADIKINAQVKDEIMLTDVNQDDSGVWDVTSFIKKAGLDILLDEKDTTTLVILPGKYEIRCRLAKPKVLEDIKLLERIATTGLLKILDFDPTIMSDASLDIYYDDSDTPVTKTFDTLGDLFIAGCELKQVSYYVFKFTVLPGQSLNLCELIAFYRNSEKTVIEKLGADGQYHAVDEAHPLDTHPMEQILDEAVDVAIYTPYLGDPVDLTRVQISKFFTKYKNTTPAWKLNVGDVLEFDLKMPFNVKRVKIMDALNNYIRYLEVEVVTPDYFAVPITFTEQPAVVDTEINSIIIRNIGEVDVNIYQVIAELIFEREALLQKGSIGTVETEPLSVQNRGKITEEMIASGYRAGEPNVPLSRAEIKTLFDVVTPLYFDIGPSETIVLIPKETLDIKRLKIIDPDNLFIKVVGAQQIEVGYTTPDGTNTVPTDSPVVVDGEVSKITITNIDQENDYYIHLIGELVESREIYLQDPSGLPVKQSEAVPLNTKLDQTLVLEDVEVAVLTVNNVHTAIPTSDIAALFDKDYKTYYEIPKAHDINTPSYLTLNLKEIKRLKRFKAINGSVNYLPLSATTTEIILYYPDGTHKSYALGYANILVNAEVISIDIVNHSTASTLPVYEITGENFWSVDLVHSEKDPINTKLDQELVLEDVQYATLGGTAIDVSTLAALFDKDRLTYYTLLRSKTLALFLKTPKRLKRLKLTDVNSNYLTLSSSAISVKVYFPDGTTATYATDAANIVLDQQINEIDIINNNAGNDYNIYTLIGECFWAVEAFMQSPPTRDILYGQWNGDRTPFYNVIGQVVVFQAGGYVSCVPTDIGIMVQDNGADVGYLRDYNNTTRTWYVETTSGIANGHTVQVTAHGGTGTGTTTGASTAGLYIRTLILNPKTANLSSSSADVLDYDYKNYDQAASVPGTAKALLLTKEFALNYVRTQPVIVQGSARAVTTTKCKADGTHTFYVDSIKLYLYKDNQAGTRTLLFSEEYPNSGAGLLSTSGSSYTDPVTASAIGTITKTQIQITDILVLKIEVYGHVGANFGSTNDALRLYFSRGSAETFLELPALTDPGLV